MTAGSPHGVLPRSGCTIIAHTDRKAICVLYGLPVPLQSHDTLAHRAQKVKSIVHSGKEVIIVVRFLGLEKSIGNPDLPLSIYIKIGCRLFHGSTQILPCRLEHTQRVGIDIGCNDIAHRNVLCKSADVVGKHGEGQIRPARPELHTVEEIRNRGPVQRHIQALARPDIPGQMSDGPVQPILQVLPNFAFQRSPGLLRTGRHKRRSKAAFIVHLYLHILPCVAGRLYDMRAGPFPARQGDMLVSGQKQVDGEFLTDPAGLILIGRRNALSTLQILLKPAVIDADDLVYTQLLQGIHGLTCRLDGVCDLQPLQVFLLFPHLHPVGDDAEKTDFQSVFQGAHRIGRDGEVSGQVGDISAQALSGKPAEVVRKPGPAIVEVMIAQGNIVVAPRIHGLTEHPLSSFLLMFLKKVGQRRPLDGVAAVDDKGIAVLGEAYGEEPHGHRLRGGEGRIVQIPVCVGSKVNGKFCHVSLL